MTRSRCPSLPARGEIWGGRLRGGTRAGPNASGHARGRERRRAADHRESNSLREHFCFRFQKNTTRLLHMHTQQVNWQLSGLAYFFVPGDFFLLRMYCRRFLSFTYVHHCGTERAVVTWEKGWHKLSSGSQCPASSWTLSRSGRAASASSRSWPLWRRRGWRVWLLGGGRRVRRRCRAAR